MKRPCLVLLLLIFAFASNAQSSEPVFTVHDLKPFAGCTLRTDVQFEIGKVTLRPESKPLLDSLVEFLEKNNGVVLRIIRYGDKSNPEMSMRLGDRRAKTIRDYFVSKGINAERLSTMDYGLLRPLVSKARIDSTKNPEEKTRLENKNRRTEFEIVRTNYIDPVKSFRDTLQQFVTDSFNHNCGKVRPENGQIRKPFKYIGTDTVYVVQTWTGDPHYICDYPQMKLEPGKVYTITACFHHRGRKGPFDKRMGLIFNNGQRLDFHFTGEVVPE